MSVLYIVFGLRGLGGRVGSGLGVFGFFRFRVFVFINIVRAVIFGNFVVSRFIVRYFGCVE